MGNYYTNFTVKHGDAQEIAEALSQAGRSAILSPPLNGFVVVYDMACEGQDLAELESVGNLLSSTLGCSVLGVLNHGDDVLLLLVFDRGEVIDEYNSCPDYFVDKEPEGPVGGNSELLCRVFSPKANLAELERVLRDDEEYAFAFERHEAIVNTLGLPGFAVASGYKYIEQGEIPEGIDPSDLLRVR
jgi:hypothetical protein